MTEIATTIDRDRDLTEQMVRGEVTAQEIVDALAACFAGEPTRYILWDCSEALLERLTPGDVRTVVQATLRYTGRRPGGKTALVFSSTFAYGLGRMLDQSLSASDSPVEFRSFHDRASALAWLGGD